MNNIFSIWIQKDNPFLSAQPQHSVPLDGTVHARLVNMRVLRERLADEPGDDSERQIWFHHLHSENHKLRQCMTERSLTSWFLKGYEYYRPEWGKAEHENTDWDELERAFQSGAMRTLTGYHANIQGILEKIDAQWGHGAEQPKQMPPETSSFWCSRRSEDMEQRSMDESRRNWPQH